MSAGVPCGGANGHVHGGVHVAVSAIAIKAEQGAYRLGGGERAKTSAAFGALRTMADNKTLPALASATPTCSV